MYKIYVNQKCMVLGKNFNEFSEMHDCSRINATDITDYYALAEDFLQQSQNLNVLIKCQNSEKEFKRFMASFKLIRAAGGLVKNKHKEFLLIFRHGLWDLPKGKIDKGEKDEEAAKREVTEETGINRLQITSKLAISYHLFLQKDRLALKECVWYKMHTDSCKEPVPEVKEGITKAVWLTSESVKVLLPDSFRSVADVLKTRIK